MLGREERFEHPFAHLGRHAGPGVAERNLAPAVPAHDGDVHAAFARSSPGPRSAAGSRRPAASAPSRRPPSAGRRVRPRRRRANTGSRLSRRAVASTSGPTITLESFGERGRAKSSRSCTISFSESRRARMSPMTDRSRLCGRHARADHLQRAADAGERVLHLVRDDGRHLAEPGQRGLLAQQVLGSLPLGDVVADRHVLVGPARLVEERDDRRVHPVGRAVLRAVPQLALPDPAGGNRAPQLADVGLRVVAGVDDPVVAADQLLARELRDLAELLVGVLDDAARVGRGDDRRLVDRPLQVFELLERPLAWSRARPPCSGGR